MPSTPGRNGLLMTRQQVIPIEERELSLLYQMVRKNEAGVQPVISPAMSPVELPRVAIPEDEEVRNVMVKSPVVTPGRGSPTESGTSSEGSSKMEQFKKMQGISLMTLDADQDGVADVAVSGRATAPTAPLFSPRLKY